MERNTVWEALKKNIFEIFPEYKNRTINPTDSLRDLGANSVDRAEIIMLTLVSLKLRIPWLSLPSDATSLNQCRHDTRRY